MRPNPANPNDTTLRDELRPGDREAILAIVRATRVFADYEVDVAAELIDERTRRGDASGYFFVVAEIAGRVVGYACYGPIACTVGSFDFYWIAVDPALHGRGIGRRIAADVEARIARAGGRRIYVETSSRADYTATRAFYDRCAYVLEARMKDFYSPGDDKMVYGKSVR